MLRFSQFISEEAKEIPFEKNPKIGWWRDKAEQDGYHTVYHGTHVRNLKSVLKHGLTHKDPKTGMISVTHDPHTAHGYASMAGAGGEAEFRKGSSANIAKHTPDHERIVLKMHIPKHFVDKHLDPNLSGNYRLANKKTALHDKETYDEWRRKNPHHPDSSYYSVSELRLDHEIPPHFIVGYMHKKKAST